MVDTPRKTFPELQALTAPVVDSDVLAVYRSPGPAKRTTAAIFSDYIKAFFSASGGSALLGFIQNLTGAVATTVQAKLRNDINVFDFFTAAEWADALTGAPAIDTTTKIQAAIDAGASSNRRVVAYGTFRVSSKIVFKCDVDFGEAMFKVYSTPAIACEISTGVGADPTTIFKQLSSPMLVMPSMENMTKPALGWAGQGIGVRMVNCQNVTVTLPLIHNFAVGVQLTSYSQSCLHNTINVGLLLNNKVNIQATVGDSGASTNSNTFNGPGHCVHFSDEGTAVSGVRHIEILPHPTFSQINHFVFQSLSLEGTAEDYHVYDGGQSNNYITCRWETNNGPRFRQGQSSPAQSGQGGNHTIAYGYGVDENSYLTITNDTGADTRITVLGVGLGRRSSSGPIDLQTSVGAGEPVYRGFTSADNLNTIVRASRWSWHLSDAFLQGKLTADNFARIKVDFANGGFDLGNGVGAPTASIRAFGSSSIEVRGNTYWPQQALNAGNVGGFGTLSYMNTDKWQTTLATGTIKVFVVSDSASWSAMTGTGSKATIAAAAAGTASVVYVQAELQGALNRIAAMEARMKAYDDAFFASNLIS
jgi:hypothetical protein